jgi:hypothetical protein
MRPAILVWAAQTQIAPIHLRNQALAPGAKKAEEYVPQNKKTAKQLSSQ